MTYEEEGQARLRRQRSKHAIALAMQGRWKEAITVNQEIIDNFPKDIEAYNRLGRAYMQLGMYAKSSDAYSYALELDSYNNIAKKNLQRLAQLGEGEEKAEEDINKAEPHHFIEEVGKAGVIKLNYPPPRHVTVRLAAGDQLYLRIAGSNLTAGNNHGEYVGQIDPKIAQRLIRLMQGGNRYAANVISASDDNVTAIIRETYQDPSQTGQMSFPSKTLRDSRTYVSDNMLRERMGYEESYAEDALDQEDEEDSNN